MEVIGITPSGEELLLDAASVRINREYAVPADDAQITVAPWDGELPELARIRITEGEVVFSGTVDVIERSSSESGSCLKIEARSLAGVLLDNEARPAVYSGVSTRMIFENYLRPCGIESYSGREVMLEGKFTVTKGMSCWQVLSEFCGRSCKSVPYAAPDGVVYFEPNSGEETDFSNYSAFSERKSRCRLISRVCIKAGDSTEYDSFVESQTASDAGVTAVRYLDASQSGVLPMAAAQEMLNLGEEDYYAVELTYPSCVLPFPGSAARVGDIGGLFVSRVRYSRTQSGEVTVVQLKKSAEQIRNA